ncbi:MAG: N-acetylmuramoyl-L-alanine amidase-like domain-containing protein [Longimicrobiales bacterium]|jgi:hypothetical protein
MVQYRAVFGPVAVIALFLIGMRWSPFEPHPPPADPSGSPTGVISWNDHDWDVFSSVIAGAAEGGLDALPMGELMAVIGQSFVGTAYLPGTLEADGPERLVINFRAFDCMTFVETVHALSVVLKNGAADRLDDRASVETEYEQVVQALRYRNGFLNGYESRLHYFSEWIYDNDRRRLITDISRDLGGVLDREVIDFMSTHPDAYGQLSNPRVLEDIESIERRLSQRGRYFIPQDRIAAVTDRIQNGDIIAATSTIDGLDVAHTGLAVWIDDELHLLYAPLDGESVEISERSLAARIQSIDSQDGIIVARPHEPGAATLTDNETEDR